MKTTGIEEINDILLRLDDVTFHAHTPWWQEWRTTVHEINKKLIAGRDQTRQG